jgi:AraC family transcriptional activator of mtrCDE
MNSKKIKYGDERYHWTCTPYRQAAERGHVMTTFDQLIEDLEVGVSAFAICDVREDAKCVIRDDTDTTVHYVLSGTGTAWQASGQSFPLAPHTFMILPPGASVVISNEQGADIEPSDPDCEPLPGDWDHLTVGKGAPGIRLACGLIHAMHLEATGLFDPVSVPPVVDFSDDPSFRVTFRRLLEELAAPKPGTRVLAELLMKQCLIILLRRQSETKCDSDAS